MKLGETKRKIICKECDKQIGWLKDLVIESDWKGGVGSPVICMECEAPKEVVATNPGLIEPETEETETKETSTKEESPVAN